MANHDPNSPVPDDADEQAEFDELARRRAAAKTPEEELAVEREQVEAEQRREQEEPDGQFALEIPEAGRKLNLGTIIPRGVKTELNYKMTGRRIPNVRGGLMDPGDTTGLLLATRVVEEVRIKFVRDGDLKIEKANIDIVIGTRNVVNAHSEAGELLLRGDSEAA